MNIHRPRTAAEREQDERPRRRADLSYICCSPNTKNLVHETMGRWYVTNF